MNRAAALGVLLLAGTACAIDPPARVVRGNFLRVPAYETSGSMTYFVDPTGNDTNACTSSGTSACSTIQGALSKVPRRMRDLITISIAAGTYSGFIVSGFIADESAGGTVGLLISGTLANSSLVSGTATGTATGGTTGSSQTFGTLIDSGQIWTTNDLTGRLLCTSNVTSCIPIESNTSTSITVISSIFNSWTAPVAGVSTYAIMDSATIVNTSVTLPGGPAIAPIASRAGIIVIDNYANAREGMITFQNIMVSNSTGRAGIVLGGSGSYMLNQMQIRPTGTGSFDGILANTESMGFGLGLPQLAIQNTDVYLPNASTGIALLWGAPTMVGIFGSQFRGSSSSFGIDGALSPNMNGWEITGFTNGMLLNGSLTTGNSTINSGHINCSTYTNSSAIVIGTAPATGQIGAQAGASGIDHVQVSVCAVGLIVDGVASAELHGMTGSVGTTLAKAMNGGYVGVNEANLTTASVQIGDGGTGQYFVDLDNGAVTATSSTDFTAGHCISNLEQGSHACGR